MVLTEEALRDAIAVVGEWDVEGARSAESALQWMGWDGEAPLVLRRYDVQLFCWYTLPRKFLASLDDKRQAVRALAVTLERLGEPAASYAQVCRSSDTEQLLAAWEDDDPSAPSRLRTLLDRSGIEPPDTDLLAWGEVMGLDEACVREQVATALEEAIEDGCLKSGARGFRRAQAQVVHAALREPYDDHGRSRLEAVHAERFERWAQRGHTRGSEDRRAIIEPIVPLVADPPPEVDPAAARSAVAVALWLLEQGQEGIALTQTGALNRALVREAAARWPGWWDGELHGPPNRQDDLVLLCELDDLLCELWLVRRQRRRLQTTTRGHALTGDPARLLVTLATKLLAGERFGAACAELAAALVLAGAPADGVALAEGLHPAIVAEGWHAAGEPPQLRYVTTAVFDFLRAAEAIGVLERSGSRRWRDPLTLTVVGRSALILALRNRALAPARAPF